MSNENHYLISWWNCPKGMMVRAAWIDAGRISYWVDWSEHVGPVSRRSAQFHYRMQRDRVLKGYQRKLKVMNLQQVELLLAAQALAETEVK